MTEHRQAILNFINKNNLPICAATIFNKMKSTINLATIYRALQFLEENKYIEGFTVLCQNEGTVRYYVKNKPHLHFLHCESCHKFVSMPQCTLMPLIEKMQNENGYLIKTHTLYFTGLCQKCNNKLFKGNNYDTLH